MYIHHSIDVKIEELSSPGIRHPASVGRDQDILIPTLHSCHYFKPLTAGMQGAGHAHCSITGYVDTAAGMEAA